MSVPTVPTSPAPLLPEPGPDHRPSGPAPAPASAVSPLPAIIVIIGMAVIIFGGMLLLLACAGSAYVAYEHPGLAAPIGIFLSGISAVGTVAGAVCGCVALVRRR
ncbi:hypothetical protein [Streptomyces sp. NPDC093109]|uniref:hypothetical protein n=1 Tax=Streptomyces sp. NPDC093109 TaxID=3154977 RepID=UPI0034508887